MMNKVLDEYQLSREIQKHLNINNYCTLNINVFVELWRERNNMLSNKDFTTKLLNFSKKYNLKYVIIEERGVYQFIRFWNKYKKQIDYKGGETMGL